MSKTLSLCKNLKFELRHIDTKQNPADLWSRVCKLKVLRLSQLWTEGPEWLSKPEDWPDTLFSVKINEIVTRDIQIEPIEKLLDIERVSDLNKLLRVTDYILKFIKLCKPTKFDDLDTCQHWLRYQQ